ncbi:hypothetical protein KC328_g32 [Hortaea werneckii]|nr:hypothetical protein KC328_g32 [Hortaea werneckii]
MDPLKDPGQLDLAAVDHWLQLLPVQQGALEHWQCVAQPLLRLGRLHPGLQLPAALGIEIEWCRAVGALLALLGPEERCGLLGLSAE